MEATLFRTQLLKERPQLPVGVMPLEAMRSLALQTIDAAIFTASASVRGFSGWPEKQRDPYTIQNMLFVSWRLWFTTQVLMDIETQNSSLSFLDDTEAKRLSGVHQLLGGVTSLYMPRLARLTEFDDSFELYGIYNIGEHPLKSAFLGNLVADGDGFIAKCFEVPQIYGYGDTRNEAKQNLHLELCTLYADLMVDDAFSEEFIVLKSLFKDAVHCEKRTI